jgi:hypothetical protein
MANIILRLSTGGAGATNSNPNLSLGGQRATNAEAIITTANTTLNNLFDDVSKAENFNGTTDYRCVYIHNDTQNAAEIFANGEVYLNGGSYASIQVGIGVKNAVAPTIANENTAPAGITFSSPTSAAPLALMSGTNQLDADDYIALWIKRTASNISGSGTVTDSIPLSIRGVE